MGQVIFNFEEILGFEDFLLNFLRFFGIIITEEVALRSFF